MKYRIYLFNSNNKELMYDEELNGYVFFMDEIKGLNISIEKIDKGITIEIDGNYDKEDISIENNYQNELELIEEIDLKLNNQEIRDTQILNKIYESIFEILEERFYFKINLETYFQCFIEDKINTIVIEKIKKTGNEIDIYTTNLFSKNTLTYHNNKFKLQVFMKEIKYHGYFLEKKIETTIDNMLKKSSFEKLKETFIGKKTELKIEKMNPTLNNYTYLENKEIIKTFKTINLVYGVSFPRIGGRNNLLNLAEKRDSKKFYIADNFLSYIDNEDNRDLIELFKDYDSNSEEIKELILERRHHNIPYSLEEIIYDKLFQDNKIVNAVKDRLIIAQFWREKTTLILHKVLDNGGNIYFVLDDIIPRPDKSKAHQINKIQNNVPGVRMRSNQDSNLIDYKYLKNDIDLEEELVEIYNKNYKQYNSITSFELKSIINTYEETPANLKFMLKEQVVVVNLKKIKELKKEKKYE